MELQNIENSKHILLLAQNRSLANATALYSYLLTLHKKVSLHLKEPVSKQLSFLPWFEKITDHKSTSADLVIEVGDEPLEYLRFFEANAIKINAKMATSLYCALKVYYKEFGENPMAGMLFARASELIALGAKHQEVEKCLAKSQSLAFMRLKAKLYESFTLCKSAQEVALFVSDEELDATGGVLEDAFVIMEEFLNYLHARSVVLYKRDEEMRVIKIIKESRD